MKIKVGDLVSAKYPIKGAVGIVNFIDDDSRFRRPLFEVDLSLCNFKEGHLCNGKEGGWWYYQEELTKLGTKTLIFKRGE